MEDEYLSNINTDDTEIIEKFKQKEEELANVKAQLDEKNKLCL